MPPGTAISDNFEKNRKDRFLGSIEVDFGSNILMVVLRNGCVFAFLEIYKIYKLLQRSIMRSVAKVRQ